MEKNEKIYEKIKKIIENLPGFALKEEAEAKWELVVADNKDDDYSWAVVEYAQNVMSTCEALRRAGVSLSSEEIFEISQSLCNFSELTLFQMNYARALMKTVWVYSNEFLPGE